VVSLSFRFSDQHFVCFVHSTKQTLQNIALLPFCVSLTFVTTFEDIKMDVKVNVGN